VAGARLASPPALADRSTEAREGTEGTGQQKEDTMTKPLREQRRETFLTMITADERTRAAGIEWAAEQLHVSPHTVIAWLKPRTSKSGNELPLWAIELLEYKMADTRKGKR
jgi:hypothetical protein